MGAEEAPIKDDGSIESLAATATTGYAALKKLDKTLAPILSTIVSYRQRAEFNKYVKDNKTNLEALQTELQGYAKEIDKKDAETIRLAAMANYMFVFDELATSLTKRKRDSVGSLFHVQMANLSEDKKALAVIDAANAYTAAKNDNPAKAIKSLSGSIDNIIKLTDKPDPEDIYEQYKAGKEFIDALSGLADATKDEELKDAVKGITDLF